MAFDRKQFDKARKASNDGYGRSGAGPSKSKAREILHDGTANGKPLTKKQRGFMGARASGSSMKKKKKGY